VRHARFSSNGAYILTWGGDSRAQVWDSNNGREIAKLGQIDNVHGAEFSQNDKHLLIWDLEGRAQVVDTTSWNTVKMYEFGKPIKSGAFSSDGNSILICTTTVWQWNYQDENPGRIKELGYCEGAVFSQDDQRLLAWDNNAAQILNLEDGETVTLQENRIKGAIFIKRWVLTWSGNAARLWSADDGKSLTPVLRHDGPVSGIILGRDQQLIMTWSDDSTVRLWRLSEYEHSSSQSLLAHEIRTGSVLNDDKQIMLLSAERWMNKKQQYND
jgi:WD40 repeat protein